MTFLAMEDVYFLVGLPFWGMSLPADPQLSRDERLVKLAFRHCSGLNPMSGSVICIEVIDELLNQCIMLPW
jgi:hypothetical protein